LKLKLALLSIFAASMTAVTSLPTPSVAAGAMCSLVPGSTLALVSVERDTTLTRSPSPARKSSMSGVPTSAYDSRLATESTPMPAARVRLLQVDSSTRDALAQAGIRDREPIVLLRAAPYRADCRPIRWTDTIPFAVRGETGFVRATVAPREQWVNGVPVLIVPDAWKYPYPHRRVLAYGAGLAAPLASATAMYSLSTLLDMPLELGEAARASSDRERARRAMAWARAHPVDAELEPARGLVRNALLAADMAVARQLPSRLRGSYRVDVHADGQHGSWYFRTISLPTSGSRRMTSRPCRRTPRVNTSAPSSSSTSRRYPCHRGMRSRRSLHPSVRATA
jgi:hypothetical protein